MPDNNLTEYEITNHCIDINLAEIADGLLFFVTNDADKFVNSYKETQQNVSYNNCDNIEICMLPFMEFFNKPIMYV